jgi:hypothetical protein
VIGVVANLLGFTVITLAPSPVLLYVGSAPLQALGSALWRPSLAALITKLASNREQGLANGGTQASAALATIISPLGAGGAFEQVGPAVPFVGGAVMFAFAGMTVAAAMRGSHSPRSAA